MKTFPTAYYQQLRTLRKVQLLLILTIGLLSGHLITHAGETYDAMRLFVFQGVDVREARIIRHEVPPAQYPHMAHSVTYRADGFENEIWGYLNQQQYDAALSARPLRVHTVPVPGPRGRAHALDVERGAYLQALAWTGAMLVALLLFALAALGLRRRLDRLEKLAAEVLPA